MFVSLRSVRVIELTESYCAAVLQPISCTQTKIIQLNRTSPNDCWTFFVESLRRFVYVSLEMRPHTKTQYFYRLPVIDFHFYEIQFDSISVKFSDIIFRFLKMLCFYRCCFFVVCIRFRRRLYCHRNLHNVIYLCCWCFSPVWIICVVYLSSDAEFLSSDAEFAFYSSSALTFTLRPWTMHTKIFTQSLAI